MGSQYLSSSPLQPGSHWVADSVSASRESHPSEDLSEPFPGVPLSSWLSSPTWEAVSWSVIGILAPPSVTLRAGGSWRTSQVAITRTDVSVLAYSVFNVQQRSPKKIPLLYMKWERPFWKVFLPQIEKLALLSRYADRKCTKGITYSTSDALLQKIPLKKIF